MKEKKFKFREIEEGQGEDYEKFKKRQFMVGFDIWTFKVSGVRRVAESG
eukprot:CAMPEP_0114596006 /NCGR_PEP_ID=MMETSP0125-20121206/17947_1 /TAXON_ID=485358 ORGANISM="Aristerostoma sp., Strain ATCC 50986" /NCGR_SAMPLE_ID=MMETSP0125 /ASSEMBLY_ACC=CAM_ASM_000245 /LENGTH=48 /DNA_ID= /DNA_START= /DNA_END= /DNA_ORIENTATION=